MNRKMDRTFRFVKIIWPQGVVCPIPWVKSMYRVICTLNISETTWPIKTKFYSSLLAGENEYLYK